MENICRSRRGTQAGLKRSERFNQLRGDPVPITISPIPLKIGIIKHPFVFHAAFLHDPSGSDVLCFTFRDDSMGSQNSKLIGKDPLYRFRHIALSPEALVESIATFSRPYL